MPEGDNSPIIVDTVTSIAQGLNGPKTTHINKWSNGVFTTGMQGNESGLPTDPTDPNIQAKRAADFAELKKQRAPQSKP